MNVRPKIGLALGGGAILGAAHIGVLKAFHEKDIAIDAITGTSIGAFVAALYAFGKSPLEIEKIALDLDWLDVSGFEFSKLGLLSNKKMGELIEEELGEVEFKDARMPLAMIATDIGNFKKIVLDDGSVAEAVMASTCVPGIFIPVEKEERLLVDGGLMENVPISPLLKWDIDTVIGVDLNAKRKFKMPEDMVDVLLNAIDIAIDNATRIQTRKADLLIAPELSAYSRTDSEVVIQLVGEGYRAAMQMLPEKKIGEPG